MAELRHPDPSVRAIAIINVVGFGETAGVAVPLIVERLKDRDASPRAKAAIALKYIYVREKDVNLVVEGLATCLEKDPQGAIRYEAAATLDRFAEQAKGVLPALLHGAEDTVTWETRQASIRVLRRAGVTKTTGPDPHVTRALVKALQDTVEKVRLEATISLGAMGPPADPKVFAFVMSALDQQLTSRDKNIALWSHVSLLALSNTVPEKSLQAILKTLQSPERDMRLQVLTALTAIGPKAKGAVPAVIEALNDKEPEVVVGACLALVSLGDKSEKVRAALAKVTEHKERPLIWYACQALSEMGNEPDVMATLTRVANRRELDDAFLHEIAKLIEQVKKGK
jgi:HEAT repeat protein